MTAHLRELRHHLATLDTTTLPGIWPERISTHIHSIVKNLEPAIATLATLAHTPREPDHAYEPTNDERHHQGDRKTSPVEAAASLATGPQRIIDGIDTDLSVGLAHLRIALAPGWGSNVRDHCRLAWNRLGNARSTIEKHAGIQNKSGLLCSGLHIAGFAYWGNEECQSVASVGPSGTCDHNGLCIACSLKRKAWQARKDYRDRGRSDRRGIPA